MRHRKNLRGWRPAPKAWAYRAARTWPAHFGMTDILKACYPQSRIPRGGEKVMEIPPWAKLAFERHWISMDAYVAIPREWRGRVTVGMPYEDNPFLGRIRKNYAGWT